jgi:hypothetical protein
MVPGNSLRAVTLLCISMLAVSFQTLLAQVDTIPRRDTTRPKSDTSMREPISAAPAPMTFVDLNTGAPVELVYDTVRYMAINKTTRQPVEFYVVNNVDTVHGMTGLIVNNMLVRPATGKIRLDERKVRIMGDELQIINPEGRRLYWTPQGWQTQEFGMQGEVKSDVKGEVKSDVKSEVKTDVKGDVKQKGEVKQKGTEKKGKIKDEWGTIKWKKGEWKYERDKGM